MASGGVEVGNLRLWAAIGNIFRVFAILSLIGGLVAVLNTVNLFRGRAGDNVVFISGAFAALILVIAFLFWEAKPALVSASPGWARWVAGIYVVLWIVSTVGAALLFIGLAYFFTGEPETPSVWRREPDRPAPPRHRPPANWQATGKVGLSGATVYSDPQRQEPVGILDSEVPVQVLDLGGGVARVVAKTGLGGWIDARTLS